MNYYFQLAQAMLSAYCNAQKQIRIESKQKPFISMKLTQTTLEICIN